MKRLMEKTVFSGLVMAWRLGHLPDQPFAALGKCDHRRRGPVAFLIWR